MCISGYLVCYFTLILVLHLILFTYRRLYLAAVHYSENADREQATSAGQAVYPFPGSCPHSLKNLQRRELLSVHVKEWSKTSKLSIRIRKLQI